ncbi:MAG: ATP-binding cassette domain-containing protein [Deltaproteobacteria bacterium]|jgi:molybdate transport system ATP-binding protein|nr:ATP-binding cassette domain-containing protein [Deltaproteobacteria bacterium]
MTSKHGQISFPGTTALEVCLEKRFGPFCLEVDFELAEVGITVVFGPSGAGKTTFLNLLAGLERPDRGFIRYRDRVFYDSSLGLIIPPEKRNLSYVFQQPRLFSHFSVATNLLFSARFCGRKVAKDSFDRVVDILGLRPLLSRQPHTLSGGESQRVAIGRALLSRSLQSLPLMLMDEPLSSLDRSRKTELLDYVVRIPGQFGVPIIYVTHSEDELLFLADQVLNINSGRSTLLSGTDFEKVIIPLSLGKAG